MPSPQENLSRSRQRLQFLRGLQKRPNLSESLRRKLPSLVEMQERAVRLRERAASLQN